MSLAAPLPRPPQPTSANLKTRCPCPRTTFGAAASAPAPAKNSRLETLASLIFFSLTCPYDTDKNAVKTDLNRAKQTPNQAFCNGPLIEGRLRCLSLPPFMFFVAAPQGTTAESFSKTPGGGY
jgi:hypothetical protein